MWNLDLRVGARIRELLEDFDVLASVNHMALIKRGGTADESFRRNIQTALIASHLGLSSLDYAQRRYLDDRPRSEKSNSDVLLYTEAYGAAKNYMRHAIAKLEPSEEIDLTLGAFGASLVLQRLEPSFFCAHLLYRLGHRYEGHAVARLILEQIAWAHAAYPANDLSTIERIRTTKTVSALDSFVAGAGRLYGHLSANTHIDYSRHGEFLRTENNRNLVLHSHLDYREYARVILCLADYFGIVWEASQRDFLTDLEAVSNSEGILQPRSDRPFLTEIQNLLTRF